MKKKFAKIILIILSSFFFLYWLKSYLGINLSERFSLSRYLPLKFMQHKGPFVIQHPRPGSVLHYDFNQPGWLNRWQWGDVWSREKGQVLADFSGAGKDNTRGLYIQSESPQDWSVRPKQAVGVSAGESFTFKGWVRVQAVDPNAASFWISAVLYDREMNVINWNYAIKKAAIGQPGWQQIIHQFSVPAEAVYIGLNVSGKGKGAFYIDEVVLTMGGE